MAAFHESNAEQKLEFESEPKLVAEVIQDVISRIGKIKKVDRGSGIIEGKITKGLSILVNYATIRILLQKKGNTTHVTISTYRQESKLLNYRGADKALSTFLSSLSEDGRLAGSSQGGW